MERGWEEEDTGARERAVEEGRESEGKDLEVKEKEGSADLVGAGKVVMDRVVTEREERETEGMDQEAPGGWVLEEAGSEMEALEGRGWVGMAEREREERDWEGSGDKVMVVEGQEEGATSYMLCYSHPGPQSSRKLCHTWRDHPSVPDA